MYDPAYRSLYVLRDVRCALLIMARLSQDEYTHVSGALSAPGETASSSAASSHTQGLPEVVRVTHKIAQSRLNASPMYEVTRKICWPPSSEPTTVTVSDP